MAKENKKFILPHEFLELLALLPAELVLDHDHGGGLLVGVDAPRPAGLFEQEVGVPDRLPRITDESVGPVELPVADVVELRPVVLGLG